jgi:hypothetical protein
MEMPLQLWQLVCTSVNQENGNMYSMEKALQGFVTILLTVLLGMSPVVGDEEEQIVIDDLTVPQLRAEIEKIQDEYYSVFNRLNENDDFDIVCQKYTPTGTNIPQVGCEPVFVTKRRSESANNYRTGGDDLLTNDALIKELQPEFEKLTAMMNEFSTSNQYFRELSEILQMLRGRFNELTQ